MTRAHQLIDEYVRLGGSLALIARLIESFKEASERVQRGGVASETLQIEYPLSNGKPLVPRRVVRLPLTDDI